MARARQRGEGGTKTRQDIMDWLQSHGGQKDYKETWVEVPNPNYDPTTAKATGDQPKIREKHVTWIGNDGKVLEVTDKGDFVSGTELNPEGSAYENTYDVVRDGDPDNTDARSPEKKADDAEETKEKQWNLDHPNPGEPGYYETNAERAARENRQATQKREEADAQSRRETAAAEAQNRSSQLEIEGRQADEASRHNKAAEQTSSDQVAISQQSANTQQHQAEIAQSAEDRENRTPKIVGTPTDATKNIVYIDPATGEIKSEANPIYDQAKTESERKRAELQLAIEQNRMTAETAAAEYKRWYDETITAPLALSAERRAQAEEQRQSLQAEEQRRQEQARNQVARAQVGEQAASRATQAEESLLPYRVGKGFSGDMASAVNSLAAGGKIAGPDAGAGVHFSGGDFSFQAPNFSKIAQDATREALKHLTPYNPSETKYSVADYTGINQPTPDSLTHAPAAPTYIDTASGINSLLNPTPQP